MELKKLSIADKEIIKPFLKPPKLESHCPLLSDFPFLVKIP